MHATSINQETMELISEAAPKKVLRKEEVLSETAKLYHLLTDLMLGDRALSQLLRVMK